MKLNKKMAIVLAIVLTMVGVLDSNTIGYVQAKSIESNTTEQYQELKEKVELNFEERLYKKNEQFLEKEETSIVINNRIGCRNARSATNDNPNGAYYLPFNTVYSDNINVEGESRWWGVVADQASRITTQMVAADNTANFDLYIYYLNEETSTLELIGYSNAEAGVSELVDMVVDAGTYYIRIVSGSGRGNCAFISYLSTQYIANEPNDSVVNATALMDVGTVTDAIDSPLDMDVYKFTISTEAARKSFTLTCPNECTYSMYIVMESTGAAYNVTSGTTYLLEADTYYLVVTTEDGTFSNSLPYTLAVTNQNCVLNATDLLSYNGNLLQQVGTTGLDYYINGTKIDFSYNYSDNFSYGSNYLNASMTMTTRSTSEVFNTPFTDTNGQNHEGIMFIKYNSSFNNSARNLALYIPINDVNYSYNRTASASMAPTSVHQSGRVFAEIIVDVNTGKVIDLFSPNWYYEDSSSSHTHSIGNIYSICQ